MSRDRLLLVEDDGRILSFLERGLRSEGYGVDVARDGVRGLEMARAGGYALIVLDINLPQIDGIELCQTLRAEGCKSLILMLTSKDRLQDKITGLKAGGDDYVTKPFAFDELLARIEALLRRGLPSAPRADILAVGDLTIDIAAKRVRRAEVPIDLTPKEFALLSCLMSNVGVIVSRTELLAEVWGLDFDPGTKVVEVCVQYLRRKVDHVGEPTIIRNVRGFGYTIEPVLKP